MKQMTMTSGMDCLMLTVLRTVTVRCTSKPGSPPLYDDDAWRIGIGSGGMDKDGHRHGELGRAKMGVGIGTQAK